MKKIILIFTILIVLISCATINETDSQILANSQYYASIGEYENAIKELDKDSSGNYKILFNKAIYLGELKRYKESIEVLDNLIKEEERLQYFKLKVWNYEKLNDTKNFEESLDKLYSLKPLDYKISNKYISHYISVKKYEKAQKALWLLIDADKNKKENFKKLLEIEEALDSSAYDTYSNLYSTL